MPRYNVGFVCKSGDNASGGLGLRIDPGPELGPDPGVPPGLGLAKEGPEGGVGREMLALSLGSGGKDPLDSRH